MRLEAHFKRDLLIRAAFSPGRNFFSHHERYGGAVCHQWAKHELMLRTTLWPIDIGNDVAMCERRILNAIRKKGPLTIAGVQKFSNADKSSGGYEFGGIGHGRRCATLAVWLKCPRSPIGVVRNMDFRTRRGARRSKSGFMGDRMLDFYRVKYPVSRKVGIFFYYYHILSFAYKGLRITR